MAEKDNLNFDNFNKRNIADIRESWQKEAEQGDTTKTVYTMVQDNSYSEITITKSSCQKCAKALIR